MVHEYSIDCGRASTVYIRVWRRAVDATRGGRASCGQESSPNFQDTRDCVYSYCRALYQRYWLWCIQVQPSRQRFQMSALILLHIWPICLFHHLTFVSAYHIGASPSLLDIHLRMPAHWLWLTIRRMYLRIISVNLPRHFVYNSRCQISSFTVALCLCVWSLGQWRVLTNIYIHIYIYIYVCVPGQCICFSVRYVCVHTGWASLHRHCTNTLHIRPLPYPHNDRCCLHMIAGPLPCH